MSLLLLQHYHRTTSLLLQYLITLREHNCIWNLLLPFNTQILSAFSEHAVAFRAQHCFFCIILLLWYQSGSMRTGNCRYHTYLPLQHTTTCLQYTITHTTPRYLSCNTSLHFQLITFCSPVLHLDHTLPLEHTITIQHIIILQYTVTCYLSQHITILHHIFVSTTHRLWVFFAIRHYLFDIIYLHL